SDAEAEQQNEECAPDKNVQNVPISPHVILPSGLRAPVYNFRKVFRANREIDGNAPLDGLSGADPGRTSLRERDGVARRNAKRGGGGPDQPPLKPEVPTARTVRRRVELRRSAEALAKAEGPHYMRNRFVPVSIVIGPLLAALLLLLWPARPAAHDIPNDVTVQAFVKPEGRTLRVLVRVPLIAM